MSRKAEQAIPHFLCDAITASQVGVWETDFAKDRTTCDRTTAELFGVDPLDASKGVPLAVFAKAIHPDDWYIFFEKINRVRIHGGMIVVEYRTRPAAGVVRWVLARGRYTRDEETGRVIGRGIVIDITDSKLLSTLEDRALFIAPEEDETPMVQIASRTIEIRQLLNKLGSHHHQALESAVEGLLWSVGYSLSKSDENKA